MLAKHFPRLACSWFWANWLIVGLGLIFLRFCLDYMYKLPKLNKKSKVENSLWQLLDPYSLFSQEWKGLSFIFLQPQVELLETNTSRSICISIPVSSNQHCDLPDLFLYVVAILFVIPSLILFAYQVQLISWNRKYIDIGTTFVLQSLLCDPNPNSPANSEAARMFSENKREYNRRVREIVEQSWTADWWWIPTPLMYWCLLHPKVADAICS